VLPPTLGRHQRILSAHDVVQRSLPNQEQLSRETAGEHAYEYVRSRVLQDALKAARARTPLRLLPRELGRWLCSHSRAADDLAVDHALASLSPGVRVAWALIRMERLPPAKVELLLWTVGVPHPHAAVVEAAALTDSSTPPDEAHVLQHGHPGRARLAHLMERGRPAYGGCHGADGILQTAWAAIGTRSPGRTT
jgi:hypothetical protein